MMNTGKAMMVMLAAVILSATAASAGELKNLKVFPADTGKEKVIEVMKTWTSALGVRCDHCHVQAVPGDFQSFDFASDDKPEKGVARGMMRMVQNINGKLLPQATGENDAAISCVTCHRGVTHPAPLDQIMLMTVQTKGVDAAVERYHNLHERFYGRGTYDFGPQSLVPAIDILAAEGGDMAAAQALMDLTVELYPDDANSRVRLAHLLWRRGDKAGASAALAKALELDPQNRFALRLQQQLER
ncbi:c-type cytochrome [bacterium]|nr:c-type cytochrome [bacterium]PJA76690.1 MAG: hypothetical protein CO151_01910 [bacterium CG_4_9_14_3_um_filter_65_15]